MSSPSFSLSVSWRALGTPSSMMPGLLRAVPSLVNLMLNGSSLKIGDSSRRRDLKTKQNLSQPYSCSLSRHVGGLHGKFKAQIQYIPTSSHAASEFQSLLPMVHRLSSAISVFYYGFQVVIETVMAVLRNSNSKLISYPGCRLCKCRAYTKHEAYTLLK